MQISQHPSATRRGARAAGQKVYGTFLIGETEFAVPMEALEEVIEEPRSYVPMPMSPPAMLGISSLRGSALPVMDAAPLLEWSGQNPSAARRVAVLRLADARVGVRFDQTREVLWVNDGEVQWLGAEGNEKRAVAGIIPLQGGNRLIQVLDVNSLLRISRMPRWAPANDASSGLASLSKVRRLEQRLVSFFVAGNLLGLDSRSTVRVLTPGRGNAPRLQDSPLRTEFSQQALMVGSSLVPVLRLSEFLGWPSEVESVQQVLVCRSPEGQMLGLAIDKVDQLIPYQPQEVREVPIFSDYQSDLFQGCLLRPDRDPLILLQDQGLYANPHVQEILEGFKRLGKENLDLSPQTHQRQQSGIKTALLVFRIGTIFSIRMQEVREILDGAQDFVRLPHAPDALLGTFGLRGDPVAVIDPRKLFGFSGETPLSGNRILIFEAEGNRIGMLVDSVESILHWAEGEEELPNVFFQDLQQRIGGGYERGIGLQNALGRKQPMVLLHARQIVDRLRAVLEPEASSDQAA